MAEKNISVKIAVPLEKKCQLFQDDECWREAKKERIAYSLKKRNVRIRWQGISEMSKWDIQWDHKRSKDLPCECDHAFTMHGSRAVWWVIVTPLYALLFPMTSNDNGARDSFGETIKRVKGGIPSHSHYHWCDVNGTSCKEEEKGKQEITRSKKWMEVESGKYNRGFQTLFPTELILSHIICLLLTGSRWLIGHDQWAFFIGSIKYKSSEKIIEGNLSYSCLYKFDSFLTRLKHQNTIASLNRYSVSDYLKIKMHYSAHTQKEWTDLYEKPRISLGIWSIALESVCQV